MYFSINIDWRVYVPWLIRYFSFLIVIKLSLKQINQYSYKCCCYLALYICWSRLRIDRFSLNTFILDFISKEPRVIEIGPAISAEEQTVNRITIGSNGFCGMNHSTQRNDGTQDPTTCFVLSLMDGYKAKIVLVAIKETAHKAISVSRCEFEPRSWLGALNTTLYDKVCQWLVAGRCLSHVLQSPPPIKQTATDITEILLKVSLNIITRKLHFKFCFYVVWGSACFSTHSSEMEYSICFLIYWCNDTLHRYPHDDGIEACKEEWEQRPVQIPPTEWLVQLLTLVLKNNFTFKEGSVWSWTYGSWIFNYLCNQCLSPLMLRVRTPLRRGVLNTILCDTVYEWLVTARWFLPGTPVSSTNKTDRHDIAEILLKLALSTINQTNFKRYNY